MRLVLQGSLCDLELLFPMLHLLGTPSYGEVVSALLKQENGGTDRAERPPYCSPSAARMRAPSPPMMGETRWDNGSGTTPSFVDASDSISSRPRGEPYVTSPGDIEPPSKSTTWTSSVDPTRDKHSVPRHLIFPLCTSNIVRDSEFKAVKCS